MTVSAENGAANFGLKRNLVVPPAVIANDLETFWCVAAGRGLFRTAFCASLRRHHVPLIKLLLFLLGKKKRLFALNANGFDIRHCSISSVNLVMKDRS
jgi:hypothetical protein